MALADIVYFNVYKHATRYAPIARALSRYTVLTELLTGFIPPLEPIGDISEEDILLKEQEEDD
jgi:hypothetical protein